MKQIITVHGIRTTQTWGVTLQEVLKNRTDVEVINFEYGFLPVRKFIIGHVRERILKKFRDFYAQYCDSENPPDIVCHSFGTLIFFDSIKRYDSIKFDTVILCGSILNTTINWSPYFRRNQIALLYNDYGSQDGVVALSWILETDCGKSGKVGFSNIPIELQSKIKQRNNFLKHGEYFYPPHIKKNWVAILLPKTIKYDKNIIRDDVIDRLYNTMEAEPVPCEIVKYSARIDEHGNYFAHYIKEGINSTVTPLKGISINTTADSFDSADELGFKAYDNVGKLLKTDLKSDEDQNKSFFISFNSVIKIGHRFYCKYLFRWRDTITFNRGDFDHFKIKNVAKVLISVNVKYSLSNPKFFIIHEKKIIDEIVVLKQDEIDGTKSYCTEFINESNYDGIIFYFERSNSGRSNVSTKELKNFKKMDNDVKIFKCSANDISGVHQLELSIETESPASERILLERLETFNEGFLVAKDKKRIVGYIETVIIDDIDFETFDQIKDFAQLYQVTGDTLYVIYLARDKSYSGQGIGQRLLELTERTASKYARRIKLVARQTLVSYYEELNYIKVKELPDFLPEMEESCYLMLKEF